MLQSGLTAFHWAAGFDCSLVAQVLLGDPRASARVRARDDVRRDTKVTLGNAWPAIQRWREYMFLCLREQTARVTVNVSLVLSSLLCLASLPAVRLNRF